VLVVVAGVARVAVGVVLVVDVVGMLDDGVAAAFAVHVHVPRVRLMEGRDRGLDLVHVVRVEVVDVPVVEVVQVVAVAHGGMSAPGVMDVLVVGEGTVVAAGHRIALAHPHIVPWMGTAGLLHGGRKRRAIPRMRPRIDPRYDSPSPSSLTSDPRKEPPMATAAPAHDDVVVVDLQATLVELIDLTLLSKQAHWNVVGRNFRSVHLELDEIVDSTRLAADKVAERIATIGAEPDGRAGAIASGSQLPEFPAGQVSTEEVVERVGVTIDQVAARLRGRIANLAEPDPISQDILIGVGDQLEKHAWMLRAQQS
jgi:starvation-inducible DNA-binding protein